jgi:outer membrane lipoprotein LolB
MTARCLSFCALLLAALLAGCVSRPTVAPPAVDWAGRAATLATWRDWSVRGRLAVKANAGGGQADFNWQQAADATRIRVQGPLGVGAFEIDWDADAISIRDRNGTVREQYRGADAAEQLLAARLGWVFPAPSTRWWLLGVPDPAYPADTTFADDGKLAVLVQNGWTVSYQRWMTVAGVVLPARLAAESPAARLRLALDSWQTGIAGGDFP